MGVGEWPPEQGGVVRRGREVGRGSAGQGGRCVGACGGRCVGACGGTGGHATPCDVIVRHHVETQLAHDAEAAKVDTRPLEQGGALLARVAHLRYAASGLGPGLGPGLRPGLGPGLGSDRRCE